MLTLYRLCVIAILITAFAGISAKIDERADKIESLIKAQHFATQEMVNGINSNLTQVRIFKNIKITDKK